MNETTNEKGAMMARKSSRAGNRSRTISGEIVVPIGLTPAKGSDATARLFDPVCGMDVEPTVAAVDPIERKGERYLFCSPDCRQQFEATPEEFEFAAAS